MPKAGWTPAGKKTRRYFTEDEVGDILLKAKLKRVLKGSVEDLSIKDITERLELAAEFYDSRRTHQDGPTIAEIRKALETVRNRASELYQCLEELDFKSRVHYARFSNEPYEKTKGSIYNLRLSTDNALKELPRGDGRPREIALTNLISHLADIYEGNVSRKKAGKSSYDYYYSDRHQEYGPFYRFVDTCLRHIEIEKPPTTLIPAINKTLDLRAKRIKSC